MIPVAQIVKALGVAPRGLTIAQTDHGYIVLHSSHTGTATFDKNGKLLTATGQLKGKDNDRD